MNMKHTFEELSLDEMEIVGGGHPVILTMFFIWANYAVNTANNGNPNPFYVPTAPSQNDTSLQDQWDYTMGMG